MKDVIAIFDVGKTNKKLLLFDEQYKVVFERTARFNEITDEDGFPCENLDSLRSSIHDSLQEVIREKKFKIKAVNFSAYGASFVYLDEEGKPVAPLYNYLKPYSPALLEKFYNSYCGEEEFSRQTASPVLGNLNSGMQLYRLKYEKPEVFKAITYALHLPQYLAWLVSGNLYSDLTSIGCHTNLWHFTDKAYHEWVTKEGIKEKLAPIENSDKTMNAEYADQQFKVGVGLHDSSAALIPYLVNFKEPFVLISTGTWCISLNPFNQEPLTADQLAKDCLSYLQYNGNSVKAARIFAGHEHDEQVKRIADHFKVDSSFYRNAIYQENIIVSLKKKKDQLHYSIKESAFPGRDIAAYSNPDEAYHQLMLDICNQQVISTNLILEGKKTKRIFVDGGFSKNEIYMNLLAKSFPEIEVYSTHMAQASALGAALCIHDSWNEGPVPAGIVELKFFRGKGPA